MHGYFKIVLGLFLSFQLNAQWDVLPERMWEDSTNAPFIHGIASGDPLDNAVIIWTRINPIDSLVQNHQVMWRIALDAEMTEIAGNGTLPASNEKDWTVKIDVQGLQPYTTYYYQFEDEMGNKSAIGRTKTAPDENSEVDSLKFAVASCSSIFSGFFNAYARMAERDDLDLVIHLGDYIYDFVDAEEQVRVPEPLLIDPQTKAEFRQMHRFYLLDPDLRAMRQQHPMFNLWDNHDFFDKNEEDLIGSIEAFYEYLPIRQPDTENPKRIYRSLHYGNLVDLMCLDIELHRNIDVIEGANEFSLLGTEQYEWAKEELLNSIATWRVIGNQKLFSNWAVDHVPLPLPFGNDTVADPNAWDGFQAERERFLTFLKDNEIDNNIVLSGDIHLSIAADLVIDPKDSIAYNPITGEGAVGVEFVPGSVTRGNVDETVGIPPTSTSLDFLIDLSFEGNPHHEYLELYQHGYGLLNINADSTIAQFIYSEKLEVVEEDVIWQELVIKEGENHWYSEPVDTMTIPSDTMTVPNDTITIPEDTMNTSIQNVVDTGYAISRMQPNPTSDRTAFTLKVSENQNVEIYLLATNGQNISPMKNIHQGQLIPNIEHRFEVNTQSIPSGTYIVYIKGVKFTSYQKLLVVK